jgi:hypothetical protein
MNVDIPQMHEFSNTHSLRELVWLCLIILGTGDESVGKKFTKHQLPLAVTH